MSSAEIVFSICSINYLSRALVLYRSLQRTGQDKNFTVFVADEPQPGLAEALPFRIVYCRDLGLPHYYYMAFIYTVLELNTAVKPSCFNYCFDKLGAQSAIYLDPDVVVFQPLAEVTQAFDGGASLVLTPHITAPLEDEGHPSEQSIVLAGSFNLGFCAARNTPSARAFIAWWERKLQRDCVLDIARGLHVDQRFAELAPAFVPETAILRHPGYNVAYWNLPERRLDERGGRLHANGRPVHFVHFSGIDTSDPESFSKHQNRFTRSTLGALKPHYDAYLKDLRNNGAAGGVVFEQTPYAYAAFVDGAEIPAVLRRAYRHFVEPHAGDRKALFARNPAFYRAPAERWPSYPGSSITRLHEYLWDSKPEIQSIFNLSTAHGQQDFLRWTQATVPGLAALIPPPPAHANGTASAVQDAHAVVLDRLTSYDFIARHLVHLVYHGKERAKQRLARRLPPPVTLANSQPQTDEGVAVYGYFRSETGVGEAARGCTQALKHAGIAFSAHALPGGSSAERVPFPAREDLRSGYSRRLVFANADVCASTAPWLDSIDAEGSARRIGHWVWELPVFPAAWSQAFDRVDEIWTPSAYVRDTIAAATAKPVKLLPYVVPDAEEPRNEARRALSLDESDFIFLTMFDLDSYIARKNPLATLRAFRDAFAALRESRPRMIVKFHGAISRPHPDFVEMMREARSIPGVTLIDEVYDRAAVRRLQAAADAFVSLHRAEGFGLNIAESMALRKAVIATGFSGNLDFMNERNSLLVPWTMVGVGRGDYPNGAGQWWAEPDHEAAVAALRTVYDDPTAARKKGEQARTDILAHAGLAPIAARLAALLGLASAGTALN